MMTDQATIRCEGSEEAIAFCGYVRQCGKSPAFIADSTGYAVGCNTSQLNLDLLYREFRKERETR